MNKSMQFYIEKGPLFIEKGSPDGMPKGTPNVNFGGPLGCLFHGFSQVPKMDAKRVQYGAIMYAFQKIGFSLSYGKYLACGPIQLNFIIVIDKDKFYGTLLFSHIDSVQLQGEVRGNKIMKGGAGNGVQTVHRQPIL